MRSPFAFVVAGLIAGIAQGQTQSPRDWIVAHYSDLRIVAVQDVLTAAINSGYASTPAQQLAIKQAFAQLRSKSRDGVPTWKAPVQGKTRGSRSVIAIDNAFEHESNDGWQLADDMNGDVATGSVLDVDDVDSWRFVAATAGFYSFEVQGTGLTPIADSWLVLRNQKGDPIATDDNGNGLLSRINIFLPAGTYYLDVTSYNGVAGGEYNLVAQRDDVNVVALGAAGSTGTTRIPVGGVAHDVFQFTVPEGRVNMLVTSGGNDTAMMVQRADGGIYFSNDDSFAGGLDAAADIDLPAGTYYAYVWDVAGGAGLPFSLSFASTPGALPDLISSVQSIGSIAGAESLRLGRVTLAAAERIDVMTDDAPALSVGDTVMTLFDRDLDYVCDVDDDDSFNPARGFYSRIAMNLPAGTYYVGVNGYLGLNGDYTVTAVSGPSLPSGVAQFGNTVGTIPGFGDVATYSLSNVSQTSVQVRTSDFWCGILGADGELASSTRCAPWMPQVGELPAGNNTLFVWDRFDFSGTLTMTVTPALYFDGNLVKSRGKESEWVWLFANFSGFTPGVNFGIGDRGLFALPFDGLLMTVGDHIFAGDGSWTWGAVPPGITGVQLQSGDLHQGVFAPVPALVTWRNGLEF